MFEEAHGYIKCPRILFGLLLVETRRMSIIGKHVD